MSAIIADKMIIAAESAVQRDQGNAYRGTLQKVLPHLGDAYRQNEDAFRTHMGASIIGKECGRAIWYDWHWATPAQFSGQVLRLFNRGHIEEGRIISLLLCAGVQIYQQDEKGNQFRVSVMGGHFGGSGDGICVGVPDLPVGLRALLECKTHNDKSFKELAGTNWSKYVKALLDPRLPRIRFDGVGVRDAKFDHFVQMQVYMHGMNLSVALYVAVNKNDDFIYFELVPYDAEFAAKFYQRAATIIPLREAPKKVSNSPGWKACQWCDHRPVCHLRERPAQNCRTCTWAKPHDDGSWKCHVNPGEPATLTKAQQLVGCGSYTLHEVFK